MEQVPMTSGSPPPRTFRIERDSLGDVEVPAGALYGANTARAVTNFRVSGITVAERPELISALGHVKAAAARANADLGLLAPPIDAAVLDAAREVGQGRHADQFPIDVVHGGGGTAVNMNANEVIANRAAQLLGESVGAYAVVHPNDHVNRSQSTNDVFPTALALATFTAGQSTLAELGALEQWFDRKADEFGDLERLGRTCLQDAVPLTVRQTHAGHAHAVARTARELGRSLDALLDVPLGATVVGTGLGAPAEYRGLVLEYLAEESGVAVRGSGDLFDALANLDAYVDVAAQLVRVTLVMAKIAADLRLLSSGPVGGIGEVSLPAVQVGSSIMPGKVNPVIPELVMQVSYEVRGMATTVETAVAAGEQELNVMEPVIARHLLGSMHDVGVVARIFGDRCIAGLSWNAATIAEHLDGSLQGAVEAMAEQGYAAVARARIVESGTVGEVIQ
jgi:aspartate ammonia-lyase